MRLPRPRPRTRGACACPAATAPPRALVGGTQLLGVVPAAPRPPTAAVRTAGLVASRATRTSETKPPTGRSSPGRQCGGADDLGSVHFGAQKTPADSTRSPDPPQLRKRGSTAPESRTGQPAPATAGTVPSATPCGSTGTTRAPAPATGNTTARQDFRGKRPGTLAGRGSSLSALQHCCSPKARPLPSESPPAGC